MRFFALTAVLAGLFVAAGCGSSEPPTGPSGNNPNDAGVIEDPGTGDDGGVSGSDGGSIGGDGGTSTTADGGGSADAGCSLDDPLDEFGVDTSCDGAEGVASQSIYVANDGDDIYGGTPQFPVKTLERAAAIHNQNKSRRFIFIAASGAPYSAEGLGDLLSKGAIVTGGLFRELGWTRPQGNATPKKSTMVSSDQRGVVAAIESQGTALSWVSIVSSQTAGVAGKDTFGLVLSGQVPLALSHVAIEAGDGAKGVDGAAGADAPDNSSAFAGGENTSREDDILKTLSVGGEGGPADRTLTCGALSPLLGGKGGNRGVRGTNPAQAGAPGGSIPPAPGASGGAAGDAQFGGINGDEGDPGADGAPGATGSASPAVAADAWSFTLDGVIALATNEATLGALGGGGGGGGGAELPVGAVALVFGGGGGGGGAGGCPGEPGTNGGVGGFSVGIVATSKWPLLDDVVITAGNGGPGGDAGAGGKGGLGGLGGVATGTTIKGGNGGRGGPGGDGGAGAPGNGGWSIGILAVNPLVAPEELGGVTISVGQPGIAGAAATGGATGNAGVAVETVSK